MNARVLRSLQGLLILLLLGLSACTSTIVPVVPNGFAPYKMRVPFRAVSPDGVMYRIRIEKNKPKADLPFWKEALKKRMVDAGYHFSSETDIRAGNQPGYLLELNAPLGTQDYTYLVALFERDKDLVIVESAGEVTRFNARKEAVLSAIQGIQF